MDASTIGGARQLSIDGSQVRTPSLVLEFKKGEVLIRDPVTGESVRFWGDPHGVTSDNDRVQFHRDNLTIDFNDGTKVTIVPTPQDKNGIARVGTVQIMNGSEVTTVREISGKNGPRFEAITTNAAALDRAFHDGTVLQARGGPDDLYFAATGREIVGGDPTQRWGEHLLDGMGGVSSIQLSNRGSMSDGTYSSLLDTVDMLYAKLKHKMSELNGVDPDDAGQMHKILSQIQMLQMRLQQVMQTLTNVMKSEHETIQGIARNLRA